MSQILILQDLDLRVFPKWLNDLEDGKGNSKLLGSWHVWRSSVVRSQWKVSFKETHGGFFQLFFWASCWCYIGNYLCGFFGMLCVFCFSELHMEIQHHPSTMDRWDFLRLHPIHRLDELIQSPVINGFLYQDPRESNFPIESGDTIPAEPVGMATETPSISKIERHWILSIKSLWIYFTNQHSINLKLNGGSLWTKKLLRTS